VHSITPRLTPVKDCVAALLAAYGGETGCARPYGARPAAGLIPDGLRDVIQWTHSVNRAGQQEHGSVRLPPHHQGVVMRKIKYFMLVAAFVVLERLHNRTHAIFLRFETRVDPQVAVLVLLKI